jgi:hypothetical protein
MSNIDGDDLVFYTGDDNQIYSGGFNVNSIMMKAGISPFKTLNKINTQTGGTGNVADVFKDLVVPSWLVSQGNIISGGSKHTKNDDDSEDDEVISDELHDKLLELVTVSDSEIKNRKKNTKRFKNKVTKNKVTKRNK